MGVNDIIKRNITSDDLDAIIDSYEHYPHEDLPEKEDFAYRILRELYIDMDLEHRYEIDDVNVYNVLHKKAISRFLDDETHYTLENLGFKWDAMSGLFEGLSSEKYLDVRQKVIDGLVNYAIYFLRSEKEGNTDLKLGDSLKSWIKKD